MLREVMKVIVLTGRYPSTDNPYAHMFVHTRNIEYVRQGHSVRVLVPSEKSHKYMIDGVNVEMAPSSDLRKELASADRVMVHLLLHRFSQALDAAPLYSELLENNIPTVFFIHGVETQTIWGSRRDDIKWHSPFSLARWAYRDCFLINKMRKTLALFNEPQVRVKFVTPSKWMMHEAIGYTNVNIEAKTSVIPNGIDTSKFAFEDHWHNRHSLLSIRPLYLKGKYAVDLMIESTAILRGKVHSTLYGAGPEEASIINELQARDLTNSFTLVNKFINSKDIPSIHSEHGIYLAVTRMDAQGVSMCEAMSSGMPTVSFDTCAIPEFITHNHSGLLAPAYDCDVYAHNVSELIESRSLFDKIAQNGRKRMEAIDIENTCREELTIRL